MADPLEWKEGEGYDIHVLRGGPSSKALDQSLNLDPDGLLPFFEPHFKGAPNNHGVAVDTHTGEVTAAAQPGSPNPKFPNFNFLMTARQTLVGGILETIIRIHVHDSIKKIWLTPSALTIHQSPDLITDERFTVLALFDDDTVGDITDWPQLAYTSSNPSSVKVFNVGDLVHGEEEIIGGRLRAREDVPVDNPDITVTLKLPSPPDLSATAKVFTKPSWADLGNDLNTTKVEWVGGKMRPDPKQSNADKSNSIESVVSNGRNILFVSEGFLASQEKDFRQKIVDVIVNTELRTKETLQPFKLLADSINYWSVFVESREESVGLLGDCRIDGKVPKQTAAEVPLPRPPTQSQWSIENMIHEAGLPLPSDAAVPDIAAWLASRVPLYDIPTTVTADAKALNAWNDLRRRSLLNERDSAFGFAHHDRPRASGQGRGEENLLNDRRRTSKESIGEFVRRLRFANFFEFGRIWGHESGTDRGLICFVCQSGKIGGGAIPVSFISGAATGGFFTASTGKSEGVPLKPATLGIDIVTPAIGLNFSPPIVASVVAHECGHAFGLGDEYGDLQLGVFAPPKVFDHPNLQQEAGVVFPPGPPRVFDADNIQWLWPRISKAGVLVGPPDDQGNPQSNQLLVRLRPNHGKPFVIGDLVRIRKVPLRKTTEKDPHARVLFKVVLEGADSVTVEYVTPSGARLDVTDPDFSDPTQFFRLNCTSFQPGIEQMLVADPIKAHIATSDRPLNAPTGPAFQGAACVPGGKPKAAVTPTNLPTLSKTPASPADIIGLYDGGGFVDCGVFRPTGQCKMRSVFDKTALFCHVCRYIIVDVVDPTKHVDLDQFYPEVQP